MLDNLQVLVGMYRAENPYAFTLLHQIYAVDGRALRCSTCGKYQNKEYEEERSWLKIDRSSIPDDGRLIDIASAILAPKKSKEVICTNCGYTTSCRSSKQFTRLPRLLMLLAPGNKFCRVPNQFKINNVNFELCGVLSYFLDSQMRC